MDTTTSFDPTSKANLTASSILLIGVCSVVCASYTMGKYKQSDRYRFNASIGLILSALFVVALSLYIFFSYD